MTPAELDALYQVVRQQRFDQIRYHAIPRFICSDQGGEFYIQVTANGKTYRKENLRTICAAPVTGVAQWKVAERAILALKKRKIERAP